MTPTACIPSSATFQDLTGNRYSKLTVIGFAGFHVKPSGKRRTQWFCKCECGVTTTVSSFNLKNGNTKSCGCHNMETRRAKGTHKGTKSTEYKSWSGLKDRCLNPQNKVFHRYGGRGITVCKQWETSFETFLADMGRKPSAKHSIDRIDNEKGYSPDNCKWSNQVEQTRNTRRNRLLTLNGITRCMTEWSEITGIKTGTLWRRIHLGWDDARTLTTPAR